MILEEIIKTSPVEIIAGLGYLIGHFLLSQNKILRWISKIIGGTAWAIFLFQNGNYIFMAVTIVVVFTMIYGFYKWGTDQYDNYTRIDRFFEILAAMVAVFMTSRFLLSGVYGLGPVFETIIVIAEIVGTVLLARKKIFGWYSYIVMSSMVGILVIFINDVPAILLGILEISSIYFYYRGARNFSHNLAKPHVFS